MWSWLIPAIIVVVIYALNHMLAGAMGPGDKQRQQQQRRRPQQGERGFPQQPGQQPAKAQQQPGQDPLQSEIEEFLRRANERRKEKARRAAPQQQQRPQPAQRSEPAPRSDRPLQPAASEEPLDVQPLEHSFDSVATSVQKHFSSQKREEYVDHLAEEISQADEEMERHLHEAFDHTLGSLRSRSQEPDPHADADADSHALKVDKSSPSTAKAMAGLLANPQSIKQAVLLKEILERPVDRW
ncbi:MAG: hypothetical protein DWQ37_11020 [Planctomycetota bacterium]|nr:MAG: hypothetical protein DWQ37_11020 [Planctomycetota bacterium]